MLIGSYEVQNITKDSVKVGCQTVTREQIKAVLKMMDNPFNLNTDKTLVGGVYVTQSIKDEEVNIRMKGPDGFDFLLAVITKNGIVLASGCQNCGLPTEDTDLGENVVVVRKNICR